MGSNMYSCLCVVMEYGVLYVIGHTLMYYRYVMFTYCLISKIYYNIYQYQVGINITIFNKIFF